MANGLGGTVLPQIQRIFQGGTLPGMTDGQLLERFATRKDDGAFEALLARYGPLVLTVCRNLLHDRDDVDDAFQATFLILVRKAGSIRLEDSLSPWIYAVAYRVATRARANRLLRVTREGPVADLEPHADSADLETHDVSPLLHAELARLPERLRAPIILCYFQGQTHEMAAHQLQWPVGTVRSRMARARTLLRERLTRKGVVLSAGFLTTSARQTAAAMIPRALSQETIQAAMRIAVGRTVMAGVLSTRAAALMEGVLNAMWLTKLKTVAGTAIVAGLVLTGVVTLAVQPPSDKADMSDVTKLPQGGNADSVTHGLTSTPYMRTYYVGDLIREESAGIIRAKDLKTSNMIPLMELITTSVAPGTWRALDESGGDLSKYFKPTTSPVSKAGSPVGTISPFFQTISLNIRHSTEVHNEVAVLLRQWRKLVYQRNTNTKDLREPANNKVSPLSEGPAAASVVAFETRLHKHFKDFKRDVDSGNWRGLTESERSARRIKWLREFQRELGQLMSDGAELREGEESSPKLAPAVARPN